LHKIDPATARLAYGVPDIPVTETSLQRPRIVALMGVRRPKTGHSDGSRASQKEKGDPDFWIAFSFSTVEQDRWERKIVQPLVLW
jgi:hypothetical protein